MKLTFRTIGIACTFSLLLLSTGCHRHRKTRSAPKSDRLRRQTQAHRRSPNTSRSCTGPTSPTTSRRRPNLLRRPQLRDRLGRATASPPPQATAFIQAFQDAAKKGLNPEDYDASRWPARTQKLARQERRRHRHLRRRHDHLRHALHLRPPHRPRQPARTSTSISTPQTRSTTSPEFVSDNAVDAADVAKLIRSVEPDSEPVPQARSRPRPLPRARQTAGRLDPPPQPLPTVTKPIAPGGHYPAAGRLAARLQLEGDLPGG